MQQIQRMYKNSINSINIDVIDDSKIYELCNDSKTIRNDKILAKRSTFKTKFKVSIIAACLVILSCVSVLAYGRIIHYQQINRNAGKVHQYINNSDKTIVMNKTRNDKNLSVTVTDLKMDSRSIYMTVNISTIDGSAINKSDNFNVASINNNGFREAYLTDGTNNYEINKVVRIDDGDDASLVRFELSFHASAIVNKVGVEKSTTSFAPLKDKNVRLVLKDYQYPFIKLTDIGFTENNVQTVCDKVNKGESVSISDKATGIKITNIKQAEYKNDDHVNATPGIFITYSVANEADKSFVKNIQIFDNTTGVASKAVSELVDDKLNNNKSLESGKTVRFIIWNESENEMTLCYTAKLDNDFYNHLNNYKFVGSSETETVTIQGSWTFDIPVKFEDAITYETSVKKEWEDGEVEINNVEISDSYMVVSMITTKEDTIKEGYVNLKITLVMNDGSQILVGNDYSGNGQINGNKIFVYYFNDLVNAKDVVGFYIGNEYVKLK